MERGRSIRLEDIPIAESINIIPQIAIGMPRAKFEYLLQEYGDRMFCVRDANQPHIVFCIVYGTTIMVVLREAEEQ